MASLTLRDSVRALYGYRCGYCGVSETNTGGLLELDHFRLRSHEGSDILDNLVYACPTCNRFKGDYWPADEASVDLALLHPLEDDLDEHIEQLADGRLAGLTRRGWFHIQRLQLNRSQLLELRNQRTEQERLQRILGRSLATEAQLREYIRELERELERLLQLIARLAREG